MATGTSIAVALVLSYQQTADRGQLLAQNGVR
jgi:hypothetical protein